jgi:hypothetical protein
MIRATITARELLAEVVRTGLPYDEARNLALAKVYERAGLRFTPQSVFGLKPPLLDPPWTIVRNDELDGWDIEQGDKQ